MFRTARCLAELSSESDDECEEVDLRRVAERAVEHIRVLDAAAESIDIRCDFDAGLPAVVASSEQLEQVLTNLLKNAVDALHGSKRSGEIVVRVRFAREDDEVLCEVVDNGPGIHHEARPFVLRPCIGT